MDADETECVAVWLFIACVMCCAAADTQAEMNAPSSAMKTLNVRLEVDALMTTSSALDPNIKVGRATKMTPMNDAAEATTSYRSNDSFNTTLPRMEVHIGAVKNSTVASDRGREVSAK